ncbi:maleylpyruvate isomerase [Novosphingobium chloroacetimidivorans]|uniref:Maleylpyruvate isomerase n=1 Tax=Novosphingobium chloroacetimidivorans TaxID=1428314 RepID=A0A7W7K734_9SPHN|nr:maleylacetoacetate isomerase [Novosphingobium chloroacetimidivorans]MBB4857440.1 maleylpyruvate isomerase [Novosphingobium chloroacetimidivorans]
MRLHAYHRSSTSYRVRIALNLKGLAYETAPVNLLEAEQRSQSFRAVNCFAGVPALEVDGRVYAQSLAILEWLDERYPANPLLPQDIEDRFAARELAYAIATELHAPLNSPVLAYLEQDLGLDRGAVQDWYHRWLGKTLSGVEARLAQRGAADFLLAAPGLFEAVLIPQLYNARRFAFDLSAMPHITRIEAACLALPAFAAAHPDNQPDAAEKS